MSELNCPTCGAKGRPISQLTVDSLALDVVLDRLQNRQGFGYCPTATCPVAWFQPETGESVDKSDLKVRIGMKEVSAPRPICYCFSHDASEFTEAIRKKGQSDLPAEIAAKCKQGLDRCEETNPQGSCCLGNVNHVIKTARREMEQAVPIAQPFAMAADVDCCSTGKKDDGHE